MFQSMRNLLSLSLSLSLSLLLLLLSACSGSKDNKEEVDKLKAEIAELQKAQTAGDTTAAKKIRVNELKLKGLIDMRIIFKEPPEQEGYIWESSNEANKKLKQLSDGLARLSYDSTEEEIAAAENLFAELQAMPADKKWVKEKDEYHERWQVLPGIDDEETTPQQDAPPASTCPPDCPNPDPDLSGAF